MIKFKEIQFINHEILGNLSLDFTLPDGSVADTIIIAGENGTGKSKLLDALYKISSSKDVKFETQFSLESDNSKGIKCSYFFKEEINNFELTIHGPVKVPINFFNVFGGIALSSKYSSNDTFLDSSNNKLDIISDINEMIIDLQSKDDNELAQIIRKAKQQNKDLNKISLDGRMSRFTKAFDYMFEDLKYEGIENLNNNKAIMFSKNGKKFSIDNLSSGEKQIVYRGCFLLKDKNSMKGAIVFIDEPEISLHPIWQKKTMNFYRNLFKDDDGRQTSQIFAVTHSPFIIHDESLDKTKVIILKRNENGEIVVSNEQKFYKCGSDENIGEIDENESLSDSQIS